MDNLPPPKPIHSLKDTHTQLCCSCSSQPPPNALLCVSCCSSGREFGKCIDVTADCTEYRVCACVERSHWSSVLPKNALWWEASNHRALMPFIHVHVYSDAAVDASLLMPRTLLPSTSTHTQTMAACSTTTSQTLPGWSAQRSRRCSAWTQSARR